MAIGGRARSTRRVGALLLFAIPVGILLAATSAAAPYAATASVSPAFSSVGDSTGTIFTFTVNNVGTVDSIGGVLLTRPNTNWTVTGCPSGPAGWTVAVSVANCQYLSLAGTADDIFPGQSRTFQLKATTIASAADFTGVWGVTVSKVNNFSSPSQWAPGTATPAGALNAAARSFEVLDAVVSASAPAVGSACPAPAKRAQTTAASTMVICGRNRSTATATTTSGTLSGTFVNTAGAFTGGAVAPGATSVVLGRFANVTPVDSAGTKTVVAQVQASATVSSGTTTLTGYTTNQAPVAVNDGAYTLNEDGSFILANPGVLANDTDDVGPLTVKLSAGAVEVPPTHGTLAQNAAGGFTYTPAANYNGADSFKYRATDGFRDSNLATVSFTVNPVADAPTDIGLSPTSVAENQPSGTVVGTFTTTDVDLPGDSHTYTFAGGTDDASFTIDNVAHTLKTAAVFDFETKSSYSISVTSTDSGANAVTKPFTITITNVNEAPTDIGLAPSSIAESQPSGSTVGTFSTTDVDAGDTFTYSFATGGTDNSSFTIDNTAHTLKTATALDFETKPSYSVKIRSTDAGGLFFEKTFTITVTNTNEAPTNLAVSPSSVAENQPVATTVGTFSTTDPDAGDTFTYTFAGGTDDASFSIDNVAHTLKTAAVFDFETKASYSIKVRTTDGGGLFFEKVLTITITNANEDPTDLAVSPASVAENQPVATTVGTFDTTDPDAGDTFTYTFAGGTDDASFTIDNVAHTLKTAAVFDFETKASYSIKVRTTDAGGLFFEKTLTITITNVNENPTAVDDTYSVPGGTITTTAATGVLANDTDPDAADTITAVLVSGPAHVGAPGGSFTLNLDGSFSYTATTGYNGSDSFTYKAKDAAGLFSNVATVTLTPDQPPVAVDDGPYTPTEDVVFSGSTVLANDTDPDPLDTVTGATLVTGPLHAASFTLNADGTFSYLGTSNYDQTDSFTYRAVDNHGTPSTNVGTASITITPVNDAPVVTTSSGNLAYTEGDPAKVIDSAITVTDVDSGNIVGGTVSITSGFSATEGDTLGFSNTANITGSYATGTGILTLTTVGTATPADYQAALRTVTYRNLSDAPTASRTVSFQVNDGGGVNNLSNVATKGIAITPVNDPPVLVAGSGTAGFTEDGPAVAVAPALTLTDVDSATIASATAQITGGLDTGDTLSFTPIGGNPVTGSFSSPTMTLTGNGASPAQMAAALQAVKYSTPSNNPSTANRTVTFQADDGGAVNNLSNTSTRDVTVTAVNDAPVVTTSSGNLAYTEGDPAKVIDAAITVTDVDSGNIVGGTVSITSGFSATEGDTLGFSNTANITGSYATGTGILTLTTVGTATPADYQAALRSITYRNLSDNPTATRTVSFQVNDGGGVNNLSNVATKGIAITPVNDPPVLAAGSGTAGFTEDGPAVAVAPALTLTDVDSATIASATAQITGGLDTGDTLSFTPIGGNPVTGSFSSPTMTLTGNGASPAQMAAALQAVKYSTPSNNPSTANRTVTFQADDGGAVNNLSNTSTRDVTITAVNDAPVVAAVEGTSLAYTEGDPATVITSTLTVSDVDSANLVGGTVSISAGFSATEGDTLGFSNTANITGSYATGTGILTLTTVGTASLADYQAALRTVTYRNLSDAPTTSRTVSFQVNDGGGVNNLSNVATRGIAITAVNDAPVNTVPAGIQSVNEDTDLTFTGGTAISIADVDAGSNPVKVTLTALNGTATLSGTTGLTFTDGTANGQGVVAFTGTITNINTALGGLKFRGTLNFNSTRGSNSLRIVTNDQGNTGTPGALSDDDTIAITVGAVNDAPTATAKSFTVESNMKITGLNGLLTGATDPDTGDSGYTFAPTLNAPTLNSSAGGTISNTQQTGSGSFDFDPPPGFGVGSTCTLSYTITDNGNPGTATSAAATITITFQGPVIWFVDPSLGPAGDGRLSTPFKSLASVPAVDASGHRVFLYTGTHTTGTGINLNSDEWLIGQGATGSGATPFDTFFGITPPANTIARPSLSGTRPTVQGTVAMATSDKVQGLNITPNLSGQGLTASSATGLVTGEVSVNTNTTHTTAVNLVNSDGTFSFTSINASSAPGGIVWNNTTNATGSFTVTGDGTGAQNASGGTISSPTSHGIFLNKAKDVVLKSMTITSPSGVIHHGILCNDLVGTASAWTGLQISGVSDSQSSSVELANTAGASNTLGGLTVSGSKIFNSTSGRTAFLVEDRNNSAMTLTVTTTEFTNLFPVAAQFAAGDNVGATGTVTVTFTNNNLHDAQSVPSGSTSGANSVNFAAINGSLLNATVTGNMATNVGQPTASVGVFSASAQNTARVNIKLNSNTISNIPGYQAFNVGTEDSGRLDAQIDLNTVTNTQNTAIRTVFNKTSTAENITITNNTLGTAANPVGKNTNGTAINMDGGLITGGTGAANVLVSNNTMVTNPLMGGARESLQLAASGPTTYNLTVTNNTITNQNGNEAYFDSVAVTPGNICMDFTGNGSGSPDVTFNKEAGTAPFVLRNRDSVVANNAADPNIHFLPSQATFGTQTTACTQPTLPPI